MRIVQVSAEMAPLAKVGGLADVLMGLARELVWQGHEVVTALPRYGAIDFARMKFTGKRDCFSIRFDGKEMDAHAEHFLLDDSIPVVLIDTDHGFWRNKEGIYGAVHEDIDSYLLFSRAVYDWLSSLPHFKPDIIHIHDWQTAGIAALAKMSALGKTILTLHNLEYQGRTSFQSVERIGIQFRSNPELFYAAKDVQYDCANVLKMGILCADIVTTVSPTYAKEILSPAGGKGLDEVINARIDRFYGILNGVDYSYWNPQIDSFISRPYQITDGIQEVAFAKRENRRELYRAIGIDDQGIGKRPLVAAVTRLVEQKGLHLIESVLQRSEELGIDCVILGSAFDSQTHDRFRSIDMKLRDVKRGAVVLQNSERLAHLIFSAADMFLVPSLFEPCGLTQIIALKYGAIPIVRRTGGLADTVVDYDYPVPSEYVLRPNGFTFDHPDESGIDSALSRALFLYKDRKDVWENLMHTAMTVDLSWYRPASRYLELYKEAGSLA